MLLSLAIIFLVGLSAAAIFEKIGFRAVGVCLCMLDTELNANAL